MPSTKRALVFLQTMDEGLCFLMPLGHDTVGVTVHRPPYHTCLRNLLGDLTPNKNFGFSYNSAEYLNFWAKFLARLRGKIRRDLLFTTMKAMTCVFPCHRSMSDDKTFQRSRTNCHETMHLVNII